MLIPIAEIPRIPFKPQSTEVDGFCGHFDTMSSIAFLCFLTFLPDPFSFSHPFFDPAIIIYFLQAGGAATSRVVGAMRRKRNKWIQFLCHFIQFVFCCEGRNPQVLHRYSSPGGMVGLRNQLNAPRGNKCCFCRHSCCSR